MSDIISKPFDSFSKGEYIAIETHNRNEFGELEVTENLIDVDRANRIIDMLRKSVREVQQIRYPNKHGEVLNHCE